jgi:lipopolysaccharide/colanic/teichoic acid biosynthesis glycosyltransferase
MKNRTLTSRILLADLLWAAFALLGANFLRYGSLLDPQRHVSLDNLLVFLATTWILWILLFTSMRLDGFRGGWHFPAIVSQVFLAIGCLMGILLAAGYLFRVLVSRLALIYFGTLLFSGLILIRYAVRRDLRARYRRGEVSRTVIAGAGRVARELAIKLERHPEMLCKVVGFLYPQDSAIEPSNFTALEGQPAINLSTLGIVEFLQAQKVQELILALSQPAWPEVLNLAGRCREHGINVSLVPQPYELYLSKPAFIDLDGLPVLQLRGPLAPYPLLFAKRALDVVLGIFLAVITGPIVLGSALVLRLTKGRGFRRHLRCGQHGRSFHMLRLNIDRRKLHKPLFEQVLERLSITELPQLWNVLRGDMSLVGPRPESPDHVKRYSEWQLERLSVKPGITGLAQVHGLREQNSSEEKTQFDLQYRLNPSSWTDISLLLQTVWTVALRVLRYSQGWWRTPESAAADDGALPESRIPVRSTVHPPKPEIGEEVLSSAHRAQPGTD